MVVTTVARAPVHDVPAHVVEALLGMLGTKRVTTAVCRSVVERDEVHHMIYVVLAVILVVLVLGGVLMRRKALKRGFSYVPDTQALGNKVYRGGEIPNVPVATPEFETEQISHNEFVSDVSDDLLDPRNPGHAEWLKEHPAMESGSESVAEHPEENPS
jgi:hypothetical protein